MHSDSLLALQLEHGGVLTDANSHANDTLGFCYPPVLHFGTSAKEYEAGKASAVLFDLSDRANIEMTGEKCAKFLQGFCTNDIAKLSPGTGCEAFVTNIKGKILSHIFVFREESCYWIETNLQVESTLLAHLSFYNLSDDAIFQSRTDTLGELFVTGPEAEMLLKKAGFSSIPQKRMEHTRCKLDSISVQIRRVDWFQSPGFLLVADRPSLAFMWKSLSDAGILPAGAKAFQALRIEACFPLYGLDLSEEHLAQEASRTAEAISFTKGCYLGQEPIARIDAIGHVNQELRGVRFTCESLPSIGAELLDPASKKVIGKLHSIAAVPHGTEAVALGILRTSHGKPGSQVHIASELGNITAEVFWRP